MICPVKPKILVASIGNHPGPESVSFTISDATLHYYTYHASLSWGGGSCTIIPGTVAFMPPGMRTEYHFPNGNHRHIYFHLEMKDSDSSGARLPPRISQTQPGTEELFLEILELSREERCSAEVKLWDCLLSFYRGSLDLPDSSCGAGETSLTVRRHIHAHLGERISLQSLSETFTISPNHLNRLFRQLTGRTVQQYIIEKRMERAFELLMYTDLSVKHVSFECGICNLQYFNKLCRNRYGCSPSALRSKYLNRMTG